MRLTGLLKSPISENLFKKTFSYNTKKLFVEWKSVLNIITRNKSKTLHLYIILYRFPWSKKTLSTKTHLNSNRYRIDKNPYS